MNHPTAHRRAATGSVTTAETGATGDVVPALDAASVILLRDAPSSPTGMEVLLLRRHPRSKAFAGADVFPGGKVDPLDGKLDDAQWTCADFAAWQRRLDADTDELTLGLLVAAVRETFEEAGVLFARHRDGTPVSADELNSEPFIEARRRLAARADHWDWAPWLRDQHLALDLDALSMWSWWVTPVGRPHRFDTRFFVATLPRHQEATHDDVETTAMRWIAPHLALEEDERGRVHLRRPTRSNLTTISRYPTPSAAIAATRAGEIDLRRMQNPSVPAPAEVRGSEPLGRPEA